MLKQNWNQHICQMYFIHFFFKKYEVLGSDWWVIDNIFILQEAKFAKHQMLDKN